MAFARRAIATSPPASRPAMMPEPTTAASSSAVPSASQSVERVNGPLRCCGSRRFTADCIEPALKGKPVERGERQAGEQLDAVLQRREGLAEGTTLLQIGAFHGGRIGQTPMTRHRMTRPHRTNHANRAVTGGKGEAEEGQTR